MAVFGCSIFGDFGGYTGGGDPSADAEAGPPDSAVGVETSTDAGADSGFDDAGCPRDVKGPKLVRATTFCVDATEVTVAQYQAFLDDVGLTADRGASLQPAALCAWNTTYVPAYWHPPTEAEVDAGVPAAVVATMPVNVVDWCDARAYCTWAGKRLCGASAGGGPMSPSASQTIASEWVVACTRNGTRTFAYGSAFDPAACNDQSNPDRRLPIASHPGCVGGYEGIYDMSGNVEEWIDACEVGSTNPENASCAIKGGAFNFPEGSLNCAISRMQARRIAGPQSGIRCCANAAP